MKTKGKFRFTEDRAKLTDEDKAIMNGDVAIYIFKDLDKIINFYCPKRCDLKDKYNLLKERWLG